MTAALRRNRAFDSTPVLVPRLTLVPPPRDVEPEELDARSLADLLAGERRRQNRMAWLYLPVILGASTLVIVASPSLFLTLAGCAVLPAASLGNLWVSYRSLDEECRELGVSARSLRRALTRVRREHRATLRALSGPERDLAIAERVLAGLKRRP